MRFFRKRKPNVEFLPDSYRLALLDRLDQVAPPGTDDETKIMFASWLMGAFLAANGLLQAVPELAALWAGTRAQADGLMRVLSLAMLARFARWAWTADEMDVGNALNSSATNICGFFAAEWSEYLEEFWLLNEQFNADRDFNDRQIDTGQRLRHIEVELLVGLVAQELGRPLPVPLDSLQLPVEDHRDLLLAGWDLLGNGLSTVTVAPLILVDAEIRMKTIAAEA